MCDDGGGTKVHRRERKGEREGEMCVWDAVGTCIRELHCANRSHDSCYNVHKKYRVLQCVCMY